MSSRRGSEKSVAELFKIGAPGTSKSMILHRRGCQNHCIHPSPNKLKKVSKNTPKLEPKSIKMQLRRRHKKSTGKNNRLFRYSQKMSQNGSRNGGGENPFFLSFSHRAPLWAPSSPRGAPRCLPGQIFQDFGSIWTPLLYFV